MEHREFSQSLVCALLLLLCTISLSAGEKIQFSSPSQEDGLPTDRTLPKSAPNLFDKFRNGGADALHLPIQTQAPSQGNERTKGDERKDWILAKPDDKSASQDEMHRSKHEDKVSRANSLDRYVQELEKTQDAEQQQQKLTSREKTLENEQQADSQRLKNGLPSYENSDRGFDAGKLDRENFTFKDFWKETTGMDPTRFEEQTALRRSEFQQIFETRSTAQEIATTDDKALANRIAPAPTDFNSRTSQSSQTSLNPGAYSAMNGSRSADFDNLNDRALGKDSSSAFNTRVEAPKVKVQPAVLPFPTRPGELFKRPGSF